MPALVLYGYRTAVAGDDLGLLCIISILLRLAQVGLSIPTLLFLNKEYKGPKITKEICSNLGIELPTAAENWNPLLYTFTLGTLVFAGVNIVLDAYTLKTSYTGTPTQPEKRSALKGLCTIRLAPMALIRIGILIVGWICLRFLDDYCDCVEAASDQIEKNFSDFVDSCSRYSVWYSCLTFLTASQTIEMCLDAAFVVHAIFIVVKNKSKERYRSKNTNGDDNDMNDSNETKWEKRCATCCRCTSLLTCCMFGGKNIDAADFSSVAIALSDFMADHGAVDTVLSDIVAGLVMLLRVQKERKLQSREALVNAKNIQGIPFAKQRQARSVLRSKLGIKKTVPPTKDTTLNEGETNNETLFDGESYESSRLGTLQENEEEEENTSFHVSDVITKDNEKSFGVEVSEPMPEEGRDSFRSDESNQNVNADEESGLDEKGEKLSNMIEDTLCLTESERIEAMRKAAILEKKMELGDISYDDENVRNSVHAITYRFEHLGASVTTIPALRKVLSPKVTFDRSVLAEGARYSRLALAIYTWMMYIFNKPCTGACVLGCARCIGFLRCKRRCRKRNTIIGDNICGCNESALFVQAGLEESDIAYAQFSNKGAKLPYCIVIDREWQSVVVAIRGTLSIDDLIRDITLSPHPLDIYGEKYGFDGQGQHCHDGMLESAAWIYNDIKSQKVLDQLLIGESAECAGYRLRVIGHSLGAGVAGILALMLQPKYPDLRGLCFSPPGCVFSEKIAYQCKDFITSYVLNTDIVPRLCLESLENMRNELLQLITRMKVPKYKITTPALLKFREGDIAGRNNELLHGLNSIPPSKFGKELKDFKNAQHERKQNRNIFHVPMFPPGKVVYMYKTSDDTTCLHGLFSCATCGLVGKPPTYSARWAHYDDFREILVGPNMFSDHFPQNVCHELERIAVSFGIHFPYNDYSGGG